MKKHDIAVALGLFLLPIGQPIYLRTASIFTSPDAIYSLSAKAETKNAQFYYERGLKKSDKGIYKGAISDYNKAIEINPEDGDIYLDRGSLREEIEDYKGATADNNRAFKIFSEDKVQLSINNLIAPAMLNKRISPMYKGFNKY